MGQCLGTFFHTGRALALCCLASTKKDFDRIGGAGLSAAQIFVGLRCLRPCLLHKINIFKVKKGLIAFRFFLGTFVSGSISQVILMLPQDARCH